MDLVIERLPTNSNKYRQDILGMQDFGIAFLNKLPRYVSELKIYGRRVTESKTKKPVFARIEDIEDIQKMMSEVLNHPITQIAQGHAKSAFDAFLKKEYGDKSLNCFFNGWNETHRTTSLVSAKVLMRLAADTPFITSEQFLGYHLTIGHMNEVAKDDFGLGHKGHDGMLKFMADAFGCHEWVSPCYAIPECNNFSEFLYEVGVKDHKTPLESDIHVQSIISAMMVSISSELWNGREYNYIAQFIDQKLRSISPKLIEDDKSLKNAKAYIMTHSSEVENKHGLHALAAVHAFCCLKGVKFDVEALRHTMLNYNHHVGQAFHALHKALAV